MPGLPQPTETIRPRGSITALKKASRTATTNSSELAVPSAKRLHVIIDHDGDGAAETVVFTVQGKDPTSGKFYTILASAAIAQDAAAITVLRIAPGVLPLTANVSADDNVPEFIRINAVPSGAGAATYSVGINFIAD